MPILVIKEVIIIIAECVAERENIKLRVINNDQFCPHLPHPPRRPQQMPKKRAREHSVSPTFHRIAWTRKRTRRGNVLIEEVVSPNSPATPKQKKMANTKYTRDQTPPSVRGIEEAMALPPIPAPDVFAPKKGRKGKV